MINILKLKTIINEERIYKRLHITEGTEAFKNADSAFDELSRIIAENMKLTAIYLTTYSLDISFEKHEKYEKYIICFVSSDDDISEISNEMISSGNYMRGYLLHEIALDVIFNTSNEMDKTIREEAAKNRHKLSRRYAPGDGAINLDLQKKLLDILKKEADIKAYLNEAQVLIPEKSLLYMFGLTRASGAEEFNECSLCENIDCLYR